MATLLRGVFPTWCMCISNAMASPRLKFWPIFFTSRTCERAFCNSKVLLCSKGFRTVVQPMKTWALAKITGMLGTHSGYLEKKTTLTWQMTDFETDKWPTSELINYRLQDWRMTYFKNRLNVLSVSGHGTSCLPFSAFLLHGVPWCSLT